MGGGPAIHFQRGRVMGGLTGPKVLADAGPSTLLPVLGELHAGIMVRPRPPLDRPPAPGEVVAGLVDGPLATAVAAATVREAVARGARIRFLQILPADLGVAAHTKAASFLFTIATTALAGVAMMRVTFETIVGPTPQMLVERSRGALLLVIGADAPGAWPAVASYCLEHVEGQLLVVSQPLPADSAA